MGIRVADDGQPRGHPRSGEAHAMPRLRRRVDDVSLIGDEDRYRPDLELHLPFEDEPELRPGDVEVAEIVRPRRRLRRRIAPDDVGDADVDVAAVMRVADELRRI